MLIWLLKRSPRHFHSLHSLKTKLILVNFDLYVFRTNILDTRPPLKRKTRLCGWWLLVSLQNSWEIVCSLNVECELDLWIKMFTIQIVILKVISPQFLNLVLCRKFLWLSSVRYHIGKIWNKETRILCFSMLWNAGLMATNILKQFKDVER